MNNITRITSLLLVLMMTFGVFPGIFLPGTADVEPNDDFLGAEILPPGVPWSGTVNGTDDTDTYKFAVVAAQKISVKLAVTAATDDLWGQLFHPNQGSIDSTAYLAAGTSETILFTSGLSTPGDYYYKVKGGDGAYTLTLTIEDQNDAGLGIDAGDSLVTATPLTNGTYDGWISGDDNDDFYSFVVTNAQIISVDLKTGTTGTDDLWAQLYNPLKNTFGQATGYLNPGVNETLEYTTSIATQGVYYIKVTGGENSYQLKVQLTNQSDAGLSMDASDTNTAPTIITPGTLLNGWICDDDKKDIYGFNVSKGQKVSVFMKTGTKRTDDLWAELYSPLKVKLIDTNYLNPDVSQTITYTTNIAAAGIYYVTVTGGDNTYTLRVTLIDQNDAGKGVDAPDDTPGLALTAGTDYPGWIYDADSKDFYSVNLTNGQILTVNFTTGQTNTDDLWMELLDPAKVIKTDTGYVNSGVSGQFIYTTSFENGGMYYLKALGGENDYKFSINITNQSDGGCGHDAPDAYEKAVNLPTGSYTGWLANDDNTDVFNISVKANHIFTVNFTSGPGEVSPMSLVILDGSKAMVKTIDSAPDVKATYTLPAEKMPLTNTIYYLKVMNGEKKTYSLDVYLPELPPDTTTPMVTILTPVQGMAFGTAATIITGTATDTVGTISKVEWSLDNATWTLCTGAGAWNCNVTLAAGANKVTIKATDNSGNKGFNDITLHFDGTVPDVTVTGVDDGSKVKKSKLTITGTASDNVALAKVEVQVNGGSWELATGTTAWSYTATLKSGKNVIVIKATDTAGNTVVVTRNVEYKKASSGGGFIPGFEAIIFLGAAIIAFLAMASRRKN